MWVMNYPQITLDASFWWLGRGLRWCGVCVGCFCRCAPPPPTHAFTGVAQCTARPRHRPGLAPLPYLNCTIKQKLQLSADVFALSHTMENRKRLKQRPPTCLFHWVCPGMRLFCRMKATQRPHPVSLPPPLTLEKVRPGQLGVDRMGQSRD